MKQLITLLLALITLTGQAKNERSNERVWNDVVTGYNNTYNQVNVTKVAFYEDRTELSLHVDLMAGQWISIAEKTFLQADGKQYAVKDVTVLKLGEQYTLPTDTLDFKIIFEPVPLDILEDIQCLDMIEPGGWYFPNIRSASMLPKDIINTYWRDEATGDWLIGIGQNHVIYNNKVYDIALPMEKKGAYTLNLTDGTVIQVSKMKKGLRTFTIGNGKPVVCSPITTAALPDYPTKDTRRGFVDNGYSMTDSVTIIGWLKDMPPYLQQQNQEFSVECENILTHSRETSYAKLDSLGRFTLKMPLFNTTDAFLDWRRSTISAVLEPGKTYFLLYDFWMGQKLWMGEDVRLENEMLAHSRSRSLTAEAEVPYDEPEVDLMAYWAKCDDARQRQEAYLEALQQSHPTLSQRYIDYENDYYRMRQGRNMSQCGYHAKGHIIPQEYLDYVSREFWKKAPKPYTIHYNFSTLNNDIIYHLMNTRVQDGLVYVFMRLEKEGKVKLTAEEYRAMEDFYQKVNQINAELIAAKTDEERQKIAEAFNGSETVTALNALVERNADLMSTSEFQDLMNTLEYRRVLDLVDSIGCDHTLRDIVLAQRLMQRIDATRSPIDSTLIAFAEKEIQVPAMLAAVKTLNDKYLAIQRRDISKSPSLKTADDLANMSDGEKILRKIIEPYKGKIILLDIWGTWCGPCKEALSHSQEEYERLKDYDLVYLYLANNSPNEAWKSVIKEYNVLGDNVVHYNLPAQQQYAIEHFLSVSAFPTYKLIDRDGTILEVNANPRQLEGLARLLDQMK